MAFAQKPGTEPAPSPAPISPPPKRHSPKERLLLTAGAVVGTAGIAGYMYLVDPNNPDNAYPKCPLKALTGVDCPGCGGLRSVHSMLHGDLMGAIHHNILALIIVPLMLYLLVRWVLSLYGKELPRVRVPYWARWAIPVAVLAFAVVRNIPGQPLYFFNSAIT